MEDIASRWKKLSLSDMKGKNVDLSKDKKRLEFILAAKFLTRRFINIEAMARMFRPIWCTRRNFEVSAVGDNVVFIAFELEVDVEKVL